VSTRAVFFDALGTLVELEPPAPALAALLGLPQDERLERAVRAEMRYYRDHAHEGRDEASLADLRERSAAIVAEGLGVDVDAGTLMQAIRFRAFADSASALGDLRDRGIAAICVSNWDCSLTEVLASAGLAGLLDGIVASATAGARKPDPAIFATALAVAGCDASEAIHVGDSVAEDVAGARAAGIEALLVVRDGGLHATEDATPIASLREISNHLRP
jgi:putative hydrolase of the HAD superfamily